MSVFRRPEPGRTGPDHFPLERDASRAELHRRLSSFLEQAAGAGLDFRPADTSIGAQLLQAGREEQVQIALAAAQRLRWIVESHAGYDPYGPAQPDPDHPRLLLQQLLRRKLPWKHDELAELVASFAEAVHRRRDRSDWLGTPAVLGALERLSSLGPVEGRLRAALERLGDGLAAVRGGASGPSAQHRRTIARVLALLGEPDPVGPEDPWLRPLLRDLETLSTGERGEWSSLLATARSASASAPPKRFAGQADRLVEKGGEAAVRERLLGWLRRAAAETGDAQTPVVSPETGQVLRGLVWLAGRFDCGEMAGALGGLAASSFRKVRDHGPRAQKVGNACLAVLSDMGPAGAAQLGRLRSAVEHASTREQLEQALEHAAKRQGLSLKVLEESMIPDLGFGVDGVRREQVGEFTAQLRLAGAGAELRWLTDDGRALKSVPQAIRREHPERLKELRREAREVGAMAAAQRDRLERLLAVDRCWRHGEWRERYVDHGLVGPLARRLIWLLGSPYDSRAAVFLDGRLVDVEGVELSDQSPDEEVRLWHPIGTSADEVRAWRVFLEEQGLRQPFKQAHREVYLLTEAERRTRVYSNRFASHVLRQHQLAALCRRRGWEYTLQGDWDSYSEPARDLPGWDLRVILRVQPPWYGDSGNELGVYPYVLSGQVRFLDGSDEPVELADVPRLAFSEAMRDVDLFVGVTSVGNDPEWRDRGDAPEHDAYWSEFAFGELGAQAEVRRDLLGRLLPKLRIAGRCELGRRFLTVRGTQRTYKIHLGSSNILMEPNDQYLCIVRDRVPGNEPSELLPFDGDLTLSLILSKAFLLCDDEAIDDPIIREQIDRG